MAWKRGAALVVAVTAAMCLVAPGAGASGAPASSRSGTAAGSRSFDSVGSHAFVVPRGVTSLRVVAQGGEGAGGVDTDPTFPLPVGGLGGRETATIPVTPGEQLLVTVGGAGGAGGARAAGGVNGGGAADPDGSGGGGAGASDVRQGGTALSNRVVVAGGGGGGGGYLGGAGGAGGGGAGADGVFGTQPGEGHSGESGGGGGGGTATSGGSGGVRSWITGEPGQAGSLGVGGAGGPSFDAGGGGGGGFYGGGGGGSGHTGGGGGGGGSNYASPRATQVASEVGVHAGRGSVTLTWSGTPAPIALTIDATARSLTFPIGKLKGTVCDPRHWAQPGARACVLGIAGAFTGRMTASDTGADLGRVHGTFVGRLGVTTVAHAPICLETGGTFTFVVLDRHGRRLGSVTSVLDASDSEICQPSGSTDRTYFLRADPSRGTGAFAHIDGGNWLVTGAGTSVSLRSGVYRDRLAVRGDVAGVVGGRST